MKNFVEALDRNGPAFSVLGEKFPRLSKETIRLDVFTDPQICQLFREFSLTHSDEKKAVWNAYQHVANGFVGNVNAVNFRKLVEDPISAYENFLLSHFYSLRVNCGAVCDESGQHFSPGHLSSGEQIRGQTECCHVGRLLQDGEEGRSGKSVQATIEKAPHLIHVSSLPCSASIQQYHKQFVFNQSQSHNLNSSLMFCGANSIKQTYCLFCNRLQPKIFFYSVLKYATKENSTAIRA
jgi:hypothetical protein